MLRLASAQISDLLAPFVENAGLAPFTIEVKPGEDGLEDLPSVDVTVDMASHTPEEAILKAKAMSRAIDQAYGCECRIGYYSADIGYDEVPEGKALIQIDLLPFSLEPNAPKP